MVHNSKNRAKEWLFFSCYIMHSAEVSTQQFSISSKSAARNKSNNVISWMTLSYNAILTLKYWMCQGRGI